MGGYVLKSSSIYENGIKVKKGSFSDEKYACINGLIFKIIESEVPSSEIIVHGFNKDLIESKSAISKPIQVEVSYYSSSKDDDLKGLHIAISAIQSVLSKEKVQNLLKKTDDFYNQGQYFYLQYENQWLEVRVVRITGYKQSTYGKVSKQTKIMMQKERHQMFQWKEEICHEQCQHNYSKDPKILIEELKKTIGGNNESVDKICQRIFMTRSMSSQFVKSIKIKHCKGCLLYGPPGTGKTLLARVIEKLFKKPATIINGPEVMDKFVGEAERKIRQPFQKAMQEQEEKGINSETHVIIFDQIDALCRKRGSGGANSEINDKIVNQLLTCIDGVKQLNNVFVIGITNRFQLLDGALLRPGRLELHIQFKLPDREGRKQIFKIHTKSLSVNGILKDIDLDVLAGRAQNYTGAQIQSLVRKALERAYTEWKKDENFDEKHAGKDYFLTFQHFDNEIKDFHPQFGCDNSKMLKAIPKTQEFLEFQGDYKKEIDKIDQIVLNLRQLKGKYSILIQGPSGIGKTVQALKLIERLNCSFSKMIAVDNMIGFPDEQKCNYLIQTFQDAEKCHESCIFLDDLLRIVEYIPLGNKFSNGMLQNMINLIRKQLLNGKKMIIVATANKQSAVEDLGLYQLFDMKITLPSLNFADVSKLLNFKNPEISNVFSASIGTKKMSLKELLTLSRMNIEQNL